MPKRKDTSPVKKHGRQGEGGGPKPVEIKHDQLLVLAGMQCTYEEIAAVFGIGKRQFIDRVAAEPELKALIEDGWANGRSSIRREQFKLLQAGNATMAIWLGKQYLGQRDQAALSNPDGSPMFGDEAFRKWILSGPNKDREYDTLP